MLIGRVEQVEDLESYYASDSPEFVALYGRRRVGKTFLVKTTFENRFSFYLTGLAKSGTKRQLDNFANSLEEYSGTASSIPKDWFEAFRQLKEFLINQKQSERKVIFFDEMPWLDTHKSQFVSALEYFWNSWASSRSDILLIVCGSASSWIITKLFHDRGGLHNRVTRRMQLLPFTLGECDEYLKSRGVVMSRTELLEAYMILGGIPFYLSLLEKRFSLAQNIDRLCFAEGGTLRDEFFSLYDSLFKNAESHIRVVEALSSKNKGLTRDEVVAASGLTNGGGLTRILRELEQSGFIRTYRPFGRKSRGSLYQLTDFYTLFYLNFIRESPADDSQFWSKHLISAGHNAWAGNAFESVCKYHIKQIKTKLGITGVISDTSSWRSETSNPGAQIDLVIDRSDNVINLCEMKYSKDEYTLTKSDDANLRNKRKAFAQETGTRKAVHLTMITSFGLSKNQYSSLIQSEVTADDLFRD
jgi:AAA+ ATPase superfamily predicted ATPase